VTDRAEAATTFAGGVCVGCGATSHTLAEGGEYCDGCGRRVQRWLALALQGAYDG
jgi:hypothetical protein